MSNSLLISAKVRLIFLLCIPPQKIKYFWPRRDSNTQPSDLESDALPLRHGVTVYWWWDFGLEKREGSTEIWTRIAGFKVQSANHYTIEPQLVCWIHFLGQDYQLSVRLLSRALSLSKLFGTHLLIIRKTKKIYLFPAGFEPATLCVWSTRDNHYTKETVWWIYPKCLLVIGCQH